MRSSPVSLLGGFNRDDAPAWSVQDVVNWLPVVADQPGTRTQYKLRTPPGLSPYQRIGKGPIRGEHNAEGRLFVVSGQTLFEVSNKGVGIPRGTVPGVGRVRMAHNQVKNGNQLAIANGQSGYIYNTATQVFTRITDEGFPGAIDVVFINGYLFWIEPFGRFWLHSDLADGLSYNTLDRGEAESQPDRIVGVAVSQNDVLLFGERTTEFYGNTGQATGTFQSKGVTADVGCASLHTIQNLDNSVMWLGNDGVVYRIDGYRAVPISTRALEKAIAQYSWVSAFAFTWEDEGHKVYYLTFPDGETFGYDVVVGLWHRRESFGFNRWRLSCAVRWNRMWIGGDFQDGRLWQLKWRHPLEGDDELVSEYTSGVLHDDGNPLGLTEVELLFDTGGEPVVAGEFPVQPPSPELAGDAPNTFIGSAYSYVYSASGGTPPLRLQIVGDLPAGLTFNPVTGEISGIALAATTKAFDVRVVDANGLWAQIRDTITVGSAIWLLRTNGDADSRVWVSGDALDWSGPYTRSPFVVAAGKACNQLSTGKVVILGGETNGELISDLSVGDGVVTEHIAVPVGIGRIRTFGKVTAAFYGGNVEGANTYWLVPGTTAEWEPIILPAGRRIRDIARLASGRWWSYQELSSTYGMYYSDEEVPRNWTASGYNEVASGQRVIATDGKLVLMLASGGRVMRCTSGIWATLTPSGPASYPDARAALNVEGRWIFAGQPTGDGVNLVYSDDNGASFTSVALPGINSVECLYEANGLLIASGRSIVAATDRATVCVSADRGATWTRSNHPYAVESGGSAVAFPVR